MSDTGATQRLCLEVVSALGLGIGLSLNHGPVIHKLGDLEQVP